MKVRVQKLLSELGFGSRRACEKLIEEKRVKVNGNICKLGDKADTNDVIFIDNKRFIQEDTRKVYYLLNKPKGYLSTVSDDKDRKTIIDLIDTKYRVYPVGRLDRNTEGLIILTNDGTFTNLMTHPKFHIKKTYRVRINGHLSEDQYNKLVNGIELDGVKTQKSTVGIFMEFENESIVDITITEGKNRQVRRMFESLGYEILKLTRIKYGNLSISSLERGKSRKLTKNEVDRLKSLAKGQFK